MGKGRKTLEYLTLLVYCLVRTIVKYKVERGLNPFRWMTVLAVSFIFSVALAGCLDSTTVGNPSTTVGNPADDDRHSDTDLGRVEYMSVKVCLDSPLSTGKACPENDFDDSGKVDHLDVSFVYDAFKDRPYNPIDIRDFNEDGKVTEKDFLVIKGCANPDYFNEDEEEACLVTNLVKEPDGEPFVIDEADIDYFLKGLVPDKPDLPTLGDPFVFCEASYPEGTFSQANFDCSDPSVKGGIDAAFDFPFLLVCFGSGGMEDTNPCTKALLITEEGGTVGFLDYGKFIAMHRDGG